MRSRVEVPKWPRSNKVILLASENERRLFFEDDVLKLENLLRTWDENSFELFHVNDDSGQNYTESCSCAVNKDFAFGEL